MALLFVVGVMNVLWIAALMILILAEKIIPAADLSEQISIAGSEASGTGNMKFALNGALIIGTLDGANVEILEQVGEENIFIFGMTAEEVREGKRRGYQPRQYYEGVPELRKIIDMIGGGYFSAAQLGLFEPVVDSLPRAEDPYMVLADFASYVDCQKWAALAYLDPEGWSRKSILNVAHMGRFSSDRTVAEYAREIWGVNPAPVGPSPAPTDLRRV